MLSEKSQKLLNSLITQYDSVSVLKGAGKLPFSQQIGNDNGMIYCRKMVITNFFCIASVEFDTAIRGQGVLSRFLRYIIKNPHNYNGVSVELIHNNKLSNHLKSQGFALNSVDPISDINAPTLFKKFNKD